MVCVCVCFCVVCVSSVFVCVLCGSCSTSAAILYLRDATIKTCCLATSSKYMYAVCVYALACAHTRAHTHLDLERKPPHKVMLFCH